MKRGRWPDALKHKFRRIIEESNADERFKKILGQTKDDKRFLEAYNFAHDRGYGKPETIIDATLREEDEDRPTTDALLTTIAALRTELDDLRKGTGVASEK